MTNPQNPMQPGQPIQPGYPMQPGYPVQPGYPMPPHQPPKKRSKLPLIILGIAVAILVICGISVVASGGGSDDTKDSSSANGTSTAAAKATPSAKIGTPVRDGKFEFVVTDVQTGLSSVGDNPYLTEKAQGQFVVVTVTVQNTSKQPYSFSPTAQKLLDSAGATFETDTTAQIALGGSDIAVWDNINPGNKVTVKLVYDMPAGATPASIELHDSMFSDGVKVALTK